VSASAAAPAAPAATLYLHPGALAASARPLAVSTILGSCVGVCLFDAARGVGGMNHFLLPDSAGNARPTARFGDIAMEQLLAEVLQAGARRSRLAARVYGGACVLAAFRGQGDHLVVALRYLEDERIPVLERDTGGRHGRRIVFHTWDGAAEARRI
jgi:chemotaxis protein CheD